MKTFRSLKTLKTLRGKLAAFTLIELLVVISIIAVLASLALPAITGALVKGQITQTTSNLRQLYLASHSAYLDGQVAGTNTGFPEYTTNITGWSNALVPSYISDVGFVNSLATKGIKASVYPVAENDATNAIMLAAGLSPSSGSNYPATGTYTAGLPFNGKGAAVVTSQGSAISISGSTNTINSALSSCAPGGTALQ